MLTLETVLIDTWQTELDVGQYAGCLYCRVGPEGEDCGQSGYHAGSRDDCGLCYQGVSLLVLPRQGPRSNWTLCEAPRKARANGNGEAVAEP
jgi:hypothetical protein